MQLQPGISEHFMPCSHTTELCQRTRARGRAEGHLAVRGEQILAVFLSTHFTPLASCEQQGQLLAAL